MTSPMSILREVEALLETRSLEDGRSLLDGSGSILYSSVSTLVPGPIYFLRLNPGGSPQNNLDGTLRQSLTDIRNGKNAFCDARWGDRPRQYDCGGAPLQRRVKKVFAQMGFETRSVPASNLVFTRSRNIRTHDSFRQAIKLCKPVHERFLQAIQPRLLLTHGSCALFKEAFDVSIRAEMMASHARWKARIGTCLVNKQEIAFANLPHLSLWAVDADTDKGRQRAAVIDWIRDTVLT